MQSKICRLSSHLLFQFLFAQFKFLFQLQQGLLQISFPLLEHLDKLCFSPFTLSLSFTFSLSLFSLFASLSLSSKMVQKTRFCIWSSFFTSTRISSLIWSIIGPFSPLTLFTVQRQMRYRRNISAVEIVVRVNSYFSSTERMSVFGADIIYVCTNKHISIRTLP